MREKRNRRDWCKNHPKRKSEIFYKNIPYCMECFDKVTNEENKDKITELKKKIAESKEPKKQEGIWW